MSIRHSLSLHRLHPRAAQRGVTLVELTIGLAILGILALIYLFGIRPTMISARVAPFARDLGAGFARIAANNQGSGNTPYTTMSTAVLANTFLARSSVIGSNGSTMTHPLGATTGAITAASATISSAGDSYAVTISAVNKAACPDLAAQLANAVEGISINGTSVKSTYGTVVAYNNGTAEAACTGGDTNTYVFTTK